MNKHAVPVKNFLSLLWIWIWIRSNPGSESRPTRIWIRSDPGPSIQFRPFYRYSYFYDNIVFLRKVFF